MTRLAIWTQIRIRLTNLDWLDLVAIGTFAVGLWVAYFTYTLRHP